MLAMLAALAACNTGTPPQLPSGVTTSPFATATPVATPTASAAPSASPSTAASDMPSASPSTGASAGPSLAPGVLFHDDFDGTELDSARWTSFEKSGIVRVKDGVLDILVPGSSRDCPLILANGDIIPAEGPFYFELSYTAKTVGRPLGFHLDYLPPLAANDPGLTLPFLQSSYYQANLIFALWGEAEKGAMFPKGNLRVDIPHRLRIERDENKRWRGIFDKTELTTLNAARQPRRFWIGEYPNKPLGSPTAWARMQIDYVEVGVLVEPDSATPAPTTPKPSAAP